MLWDLHILLFAGLAAGLGWFGFVSVLDGWRRW
jgi:hypothetical protein